MKIISLADVEEEAVTHNADIKKRVMLRRGQLPHLTNFSQARIASGQSVSAHRHTGMHEVFFVAAGEGRIRVDDEEYRLSVGSCVAVESGEAHEITGTGATELVLLYFGIEE